MFRTKALWIAGIVLVATPLIAGGTLPLKMKGQVTATTNPPTAQRAEVNIERISQLPHEAPLARGTGDEDFAACRSGGGLEYHRASGAISLPGRSFTIIGVCVSETGSSREIHTLSGSDGYQFVGNLTTVGAKKHFSGLVSTNAGGILTNPYRFSFEED